MNSEKKELKGTDLNYNYNLKWNESNNNSKDNKFDKPRYYKNINSSEIRKNN